MAEFDPHNEYELEKIKVRPSPRSCIERRPNQGSDCSLGLEICIYLKNNLGITFELEDGQIATVDELLHLVIAEEKVGLSSPESYKIFSLWFTSSLLEVQLKPYHLPYKFLQQWSQLLQKYSTAHKKKIEIDEPILSFQRSVFYSKKDEKKIEDPQVLLLLYEEAKGNILSGRYPCEEVDYYMLAALQARIELGPYNPEVHTLNFFRTKIPSFLPDHLCKFRWLFKLSFNAKNGPESHILEQYCNIPVAAQADKVRKKYLEFCWTLPFYGSAFFRGQIEKPASMFSSIIGNQDIKVLVAINSEGIYIISEDENSMLLGLKYEELCWDYAKPKNPEDSDCFPCLYLQFQVTENENKVFKILQIFSKQAVMMDALISTFVAELKQQMLLNHSQSDDSRLRSPLDTDEIDVGSGVDLLSDALVPLTKTSVRRRPSSSSSLSNKLHRLSLATFNEDG